MKKLLLLLSLTLIVSGKLAATINSAIDGDYKRMYADAEEYFTNENYTAALPLYLKFHSQPSHLLYFLPQLHTSNQFYVSAHPGKSHVHLQG